MSSLTRPLSCLLTVLAFAACNVQSGNEAEDPAASTEAALDAPRLRRFAPPQAAFDACAKAQEGGVCSVSWRGKDVSGTCKKGPEGDALFCHLPHRGPPPEAVEACKSSSDGATCSVKFDDHEVSGVCRKPPRGDGALACLPNHLMRKPPAEAIDACKSLTSGADCSVTLRGRTLNGNCLAPPHGEGELACMPPRPMGPPPDAP